MTTLPTDDQRAPGPLDPARVRDLALQMVSWRSETGTPGEATFSTQLETLLRNIPYFQAHPDHIRSIASHGTPLTHSIVALVRGQGRHAIALTGHFDTVSTDNYHDLQPLACDSSALAEALVADLSSRARSEQEERALSDLQSGDFLAGRGMLDMKSGLAAGIACLEDFASRPERDGNLLLIFTPDEERESRGIRSLRDALPQIAQDFDIDVCAAINMDVTSDQGDGREGRAIYAGTIGKLLPFALVIGCSSHASYPFEGVSAQAMAAGILANFEGNARLADEDETDISPPPICLEAKDLRNGYEVTTPERFWLAFNWLYHAMTADALFARFQQEVLEGASAAVARFAAQADDYSARIGKRAGATPAAPRLITFDQLRDLAAQALGQGFEAAYQTEENRLSHIDNPLELTRLLTNWLVDAARVSGPAIIVGFSGLHYPPSRLHMNQTHDRALHQAIESARTALGNTPERSLSWKPHFQGISDMSFLGQAATGSDVVSGNTPISRLVDHPSPQALRFPAVNIGPWGREFHQKLERVHAPYAFEVLPPLLAHIVHAFLTAARPQSSRISL
ncbi:M20/M25/M40 family metallo-hydrolase [Rhizobium sp. CFBP 8762]|uniref:M20/M25/M40 family metallo-hydrolase n=1 Tax=Rhizobium sp. CFBP 8762 TaxID=2775279 RepID=UPI001FD2E592|nr:M20/M25/M40 family metallo-hydrolase [Rhizobium sp. CFBP 8762]